MNVTPHHHHRPPPLSVLRTATYPLKPQRQQRRRRVPLFIPVALAAQQHRLEVWRRRRDQVAARLRLARQVGDRRRGAVAAVAILGARDGQHVREHARAAGHADGVPRGRTGTRHVEQQARRGLHAHCTQSMRPATWSAATTAARAVALSVARG
eukprot:166776-Chlamydomonas_euryale.AAC.1